MYAPFGLQPPMIAMRHAPQLLLLSAVLFAHMPALARAPGGGRGSAGTDAGTSEELGREAARSLSAVGALNARPVQPTRRHPTVAPESGRPYTISIEQPHPYSVSEARVRLSYLLDYWTERFGVKQQWTGDTVLVTGRVLGIRVEAWVQVQGHRVWALAVDPGPIMRTAGERYIRKKIAKYMHPTYEEL